jgi:hypothetical protein
VGPDIKWSATLSGDSHHLLAIDPSGARLYAGDGWGSPSYASLSLRLIDMNDGRELVRLRTRYQQPRSITYRGSDLVLATDSRLFQLRRSDLGVRKVWEHVPKFADALEIESDKLLMTNWLRPTAGIFDLGSGHSRRWLLEAGLRPLHFRKRLTVYCLSSGLLRSLDLATRSSEVIFRGAVGRWVELAADRWLAVLAGPWKRTGNIEEPATSTRELVVYDLSKGTERTKHLSRDTVAIEASDSSPYLWLIQRGPGPRVLPSIIERVDAQTCQTVDTIAAPSGTDVVQAIADRAVVFFGRTLDGERKAVISCATVS